MRFYLQIHGPVWRASAARRTYNSSGSCNLPGVDGALEGRGFPAPPSRDHSILALDDGRPLTPSAYRKVWTQTRAEVLEAHEINSPRGRTVSALRDACIAA